MTVRAATPADVPRLGEIAEAAGLFPAAYLPEMIAPALGGNEDEVWLVADTGAGSSGFAFARLEALTDRTWNLLALAVDPALQRQGTGATLLAGAEAVLDARLMIIETTQRPEQAGARALYLSKGYAQVGHIEDFYGAGEDKIVFRKALA